MSADQKLFLLISALILCLSLCLVFGTYILVQSFSVQEDEVVDIMLKKAQNELIV